MDDDLTLEEFAKLSEREQEIAILRKVDKILKMVKEMNEEFRQKRELNGENETVEEMIKVDKVLCPSCGEEIRKVYMITNIIVEKEETYNFEKGFSSIERMDEVDVLNDVMGICEKCEKEIEEIIIMRNGKEEKIAIHELLDKSVKLKD